MLTPLDYLRGEVFWRPCQGIRFLPRVMKRLTKSKIGYFDVSVQPNQDVFWLNVPVFDVNHLMQKLNSQYDLG